MAIALALAGIPVWTLTRAKPEAATPPRTESVGETKTHTLKVHLVASVPAKMSISRLGEVVLQNESPSREWQGEISVQATDPEDLVLKTEWPPGDGPQAVRVEVDAGGNTWERTFWGETGVEDVLEKEP